MLQKVDLQPSARSYKKTSVRSVSMWHQRENQAKIRTVVSGVCLHPLGRVWWERHRIEKLEMREKGLWSALLSARPGHTKSLQSPTWIPLWASFVRAAWLPSSTLLKQLPSRNSSKSCNKPVAKSLQLLRANATLWPSLPPTGWLRGPLPAAWWHTKLG